jgi:hypothetical protein
MIFLCIIFRFICKFALSFGCLEEWNYLGWFKLELYLRGLFVVCFIVVITSYIVYFLARRYLIQEFKSDVYITKFLAKTIFIIHYRTFS